MSKTNPPAPVGDGFVNFMSGVGTRADKRSANDYFLGAPTTLASASTAFRASWLNRKAIAAICDDMTREWVSYRWKGSDDDENNARKLREAEDDLEVQGRVNEALTWASLYGGCVIIPIVAGTGAMDAPIDLESIAEGSLKRLVVKDRWQVSHSGEIERDMENENYGLPDMYVVADTGLRVHPSRVIRFNGAKLPYISWLQNGMWDDSDLYSLGESVKDYEGSRASVASMIPEAKVDIYKAKGLAQALSTKDGQLKAEERFAAGQALKSILHAVLVDLDREEYDQKELSFSGLEGLMMRLQIDVCGAIDMPATRLFGQSPAGLTATGESDTRNYYDNLKARQEKRLRRPLTRLMQIVVRSTFGFMPENFAMTFNPLWQTSRAERAQAELEDAQRDKIYLEAGVLSEGAVARDLQERGTYPTMHDDDVQYAEDVTKMSQELNAKLAKTGNRP